MRIVPAALVIADISGYTSFVKYHRASLIHAEMIITDLIENVLDRSEHPLQLNKLEGDAMLLYAPADERREEVLASVTQQLFAFVQAFREHEAEIVSCNTCECSACADAGKLRLKVVCHYGEVLVKEVRGLVELAGDDVIKVHRLLKNSIAADEYVLVTDQFDNVAQVESEWESEKVRELYDGEQVSGTAYIAPADRGAIEAAPLTMKLASFVKAEAYLVGRMLGFGKKREFRNLPK